MLASTLTRRSLPFIRPALGVSHSSSRQLGQPEIAKALLSTVDSSSRKIALVIGSSGALGSTVSRYLSRDLDYVVLGADVVEMPADFNESDWELDGFISLPTYAQHLTVSEVTTGLAAGLHTILGETDEIDTIVCATVSSLRYECNAERKNTHMVGVGTFIRFFDFTKRNRTCLSDSYYFSFV